MNSDSQLDLSGFTIVLVEDVDFNREMIRRSLSGLGAPHVHEAQDGAEALDILARERDRISFVIADFHMPKMDGLQLLKAIRLGERDIDRGMPLAMLTAHSDVDLVETALALDVNAFLVKPVSRATLETRLSTLPEQTKSKAWVKNKGHYRSVDFDSAVIELAQAGAAAGPSVKYFAAVPDDSPVAKEITASIGKLVSESGESVAAQILPRLEELTHTGRVSTEMIPELMEIISIEARARGERLRDSRADQNDVARKPPGISGSRPSPRWTTDQAQLEKAMEDIRNGAPLKVDIYLDDGKLFIEAHTAMTPRVFSIMINLDDLHVLKELPVLQELLGGLDTLALAGLGERKLEPEQISEGDVVARDIHTLDRRVYIHKGQEIDAKFISMLNVARELGNIEDSIWVENDQ